MNTRRTLVLILIVGLLSLHTVYTRMKALDFNLRTGQMYSASDRLKQQKRELEVELAIIRQPVAAVEKASQYCPDLGPDHPELAAYHVAKDQPHLPVPSLRALEAAHPKPAAVAPVAPLANSAIPTTPATPAALNAATPPALPSPAAPASQPAAAPVPPAVPVAPAEPILAPLPRTVVGAVGTVTPAAPMQVASGTNDAADPNANAVAKPLNGDDEDAAPIDLASDPAEGPIGVSGPAQGLLPVGDPNLVLASIPSHVH